MTETTQTAALRDAIAAGAGCCESLLTELVRRPSPSGAPSAILDLLEDELAACGLECWRFKPDLDALRSDPQFQEPTVHDPAVENLGGRLARDRAPGLVLFAHFDTEPLDDTRDPLGARDGGGRLYGLGAADAKAGLAAIIAALRALRDARVSVRRELTVLAVHGKQGGALGTLPAMAHVGHAAAAVYVHPAETGLGLAQIKIASRGIVSFEVAIPGRTPEFIEPNNPLSGRADSSRNPILFAAELGRILRDWGDEQAASGLTLALNLIRGGTAVDTPAEEAVVGGTVWFGRGTAASQLATLQARVDAAAEQQGWRAALRPTVRQRGLSANAAATDRESTLVSAVEAAIEAETGRCPSAYEWHSASDIRFPILCRGLPAVGFGPVAGGFYTPHEWVDKASLHQTTAVLARLIAWWNDAADDGRFRLAERR